MGSCKLCILDTVVLVKQEKAAVIPRLFFAIIISCSWELSDHCTKGDNSWTIKTLILRIKSCSTFQ